MEVRLCSACYTEHKLGVSFIATDTLCIKKKNDWRHKKDIFTYFAILDKQQHVINSESAAPSVLFTEVSMYNLLGLCTKYVSAPCHAVIWSKDDITTPKKSYMRILPMKSEKL